MNVPHQISMASRDRSSIHGASACRLLLGLALTLLPIACATPDADGEGCRTSEDCGEHEHCVLGPESKLVCAPEEEASCLDNDDCAESFVCSSDGLCRRTCVSNGDCLNGEVCTSAFVCESGSDEGGGDAGVPPAACEAGAPCEPDAECQLGELDCDDLDAPECAPSGDAPDGTECGESGRCEGGECIECDDGSECTQDDECRLGELDCSRNPPECVAGEDAPDGTACGSGGECAGGTCLECGAECSPLQACQLGLVDCSGEFPLCVVTSDAPSGTPCGDDRVCNAGECVACVNDAECASADECGVAVLDCDASPPTCTTIGIASDGTECAGGICVGGGCEACNEGDACVPDSYDCYEGEVSCGGDVGCEATTPFVNGTECGENQVCAGGSCYYCVDGEPCTLDEPDACVEGRTDCDQMDDFGTPACVATTTSLPDGTYCSPGGVSAGGTFTCDDGECVACVWSADCTPANPCHGGFQECDLGLECVDTGYVLEDETPCDTDRICQGGSCVSADREISVTGDDQSTEISNLLPSAVTVRVVEASGGAGVSGARVTFRATSGASAPASVTTDGQGYADVALRVGRAPGVYTFTASATGADDAVINATAVEPETGVIFPVPIEFPEPEPEGGFGGVTGPSATARGGLAVAADGTLYVIQECTVVEVLPNGVASVISGASGCGYSAAHDGRPAVEATLDSPRWLALDETRELLYVAEYQRVRRIELTSGLIDTFAGGGALTGDNIPATSAGLFPDAIFVAPNGDLVVAEFDTLRVVNFANERVNTWMSYASCDETGPLQYYGVPYYGEQQSSQVAWNADGVPFVFGSFCGGGLGVVSAAIVRVAGDGSLIHVAGQDGGLTGDEVAARRANLHLVSSMAFDTAGNLYFSDASQHRIRGIEGATGRLVTIAGTGTDGHFGDFGPAVDAELYLPTGVRADAAGNLYFVDEGNGVVRGVRSAGSALDGTAMLAASAGEDQETYVDELVDTPFRVRLTDDEGANLQGYVVDWTATTLGGALYASSSATNATGVAQVSARPGLMPGEYGFEASLRDIHGGELPGSPVTFTVTASNPPSGTIFTVVNPDRGYPASGIPGPGTFAHVGQPTGVAVASDSTVYFSAYCQVYALSPTGIVTLVAGNSSCTYNSVHDGGLAIDAALSFPEALALDEAGSRLFAAEYQRVRVIDLASGTIDTFAGGGTATGPGHGDGGQAVDATLSYRSSLSYGPDGYLYISGHDDDANRIRRIAPNGVISSWLQVPTDYVCEEPGVVFWGCDDGCNLAWAPNGDVYVSANVFGTSTEVLGGCFYVESGILKRVGNTLTLIAGKADGLETEGALATETYFEEIRDMEYASGNLYLTLGSGHRIRRVGTGAGGIVTTLVGDGTADFFGEYVPATTARINYPHGLALMPGGGFVFADSDNNAIRRVR